MRLLWNALKKFVFGIVLVGLLLFLPAWTLAYPGAWLLIGILFLPMLVMGTVLLCKSPELLARRLDGKEKEKAQQGVLALSGLMFPACFVLSALDFRFGWSRVPLWLVILSAAFFLVGYGMYAEVMRENAYLSRKIEVAEGQTVVDTGLYGIVRHPMYLATLLMFLPMPLVLGSLWGLVPMVLYPVLIVLRILNEEKVLIASLEGYAAYRKRVKYRLIPFIW